MLAAVVAAAIVPSSDAIAADDVLAGRLRVDGRAFDVELDLRASPPKIDVLSWWRIGEPVQDFQRDHDAISFDLPAGLGHFGGSVEGGAIAGLVTLPDGRIGRMTLLPAERPDVVLRDVTIVSGDVTLGATIGVPTSTGPHPALVFVHGAGDSSRLRAETRFAAEFFPRHGVACLVYDKRGCGESTGDWRAVGFEARASDVIAAVDHLRGLPDVDPRAIGLFAGSQGSWVAGLAAALDPSIRFIVHHSGAAVPVLEADTYAHRSRLLGTGLPEAEVEEWLDLWRLECAALRRGVPADADPAFQAALAAARSRPWFQKEPYVAHARDDWWASWYPRVMDHDPAPLLNRLEIPMLWLYGARDSQSDPAANVAYLSRLARDRGKDHTIHVFPGAGHGIMVPMSADGADQPPLTMAPGYFPTVIQWIHARFAADAYLREP